MAETDRHDQQIYQLRVILRGISPLIWRRLLVCSDSTVAQLHEVLQIAFGWDDEHLNRFEIRGREYSVYRDGGGMIGIDATKVRLYDLKLRRLERFVYEYDFGDSWIHDLRLETALPVNGIPIRCVSRGSARHRQRTAVDLADSWRIAGTSLDSAAGNRMRILRIAWTRSMMRSWTAPVTMTRTDLIDARLIARLPNWQPVRIRRLSMKFTIQVLIESPDAPPLGIPIQTIERSCDRIEDVGLRLAEAKAILSGLQGQLVSQQLADHLRRQRPCPCCHRPRTIKGYHPLRFRSPFGDMELRSPRWYECDCEGRPAEATFSPLNKILTTHTAPEMEFLQAKWAAHLSFAAVVDLLHDVLPVDPCLQVETVRRHVFATAERLEAELGPEQFAYDAGCRLEIEASPEPGPPITVGLDGGYIRGRERRPGATGCFEVTAGKSIPEEGAAKVFAGVRRVDTKPSPRK
jgi:Plasmid pRiA4b ORF-3-like protein